MWLSRSNFVAAAEEFVVRRSPPCALFCFKRYESLVLTVVIRLPCLLLCLC
jgi:hypothetical protein